MTTDKRLGDLIRIGTAAECAENFRQMAQAIMSAKRWVAKNCEHNDRSAALSNLLTASAGYLSLTSDNIGKHISVTALCTRSLYEINLQTRDILGSADSLRRWNGEALTDKIELLEGILTLDTVGDTAELRSPLRSEIQRLQSLRVKYGLPEGRPIAAGEIARSLGLAKEHTALFKLFSKLVHPSSYLVNDPSGAAANEAAMILQVHAQLYAADTFARICDALSIPEAIWRQDSK